MGLKVKTSAAMTNSPPTRFTMRAQATLDSASFIGSARQKRRMPLRASTSKASAMNSGLAVSQEMKRNPVDMNWSEVSMRAISATLRSSRDPHQPLPVFDHRAIRHEDLDDRAPSLRAHGVHELHHFDDADDGVLLHLGPDLDVRRRARLRRTVEDADERRRHLHYAGGGGCRKLAARLAACARRPVGYSWGRRRVGRSGGFSSLAPRRGAALQRELETVLLDMQLIELRLFQQPDDLRDVSRGQGHRRVPKMDMRCVSGSSSCFAIGAASRADQTVSGRLCSSRMAPLPRSTAHSMSCAHP